MSILKLLKFYLLPFTLIAVVALIALGKTLHFYYWWEDFSLFYNARNGICPEYYWPFTSYCFLWAKLYPIFGYNDPSRWFTLAIFLKTVFGLFVYILGGKFFGKKVAILLAFLAVSLGGEGSMMSFYTISESIGLTFLVLIILGLYEVKNKGPLCLVISIILFYLSLTFFPIYSTAHIFLVLAFLFLFLKKYLSKRLLIASSIVFILITLNTYIGQPLRESGSPLAVFKLTGGNRISMQFVKSKVENYFSTTSSFLFTDYMEEKLPLNIRNEYSKEIRIILGIIINFSFIIFLYKVRKNNKHLALGIFSYLWLISQYIPRGLVTTYGLSSNDRHLYYPYTGFVMMLGFLAFKKPKLIFPVMILILLSNLFHTNYYFSKYVEVNRNKIIFYKELRGYLNSDIPKGSVIYFDTPSGKPSYEFGIFVRSGTHANEASIATEIGVKIEDIKMYATSTVLSQKIANGEIKPEKFFSFYWDGSHLINTTNEARKMLKGEINFSKSINSRQGVTLNHNDKYNYWSGENVGINFKLNDFRPIIPSKYRFSVMASPADFPLPYSQGCTNCFSKEGRFKQTLNYLTQSRLLKSGVVASVSNEGEDTSPQNLIDSDFNTYWVGNRSEWFYGTKPTITLSFPKEVAIAGLVIYSTSTKYNIPMDLKINADGKLIDDMVIEDNEGRIKILAGVGKVKVLTIKISKTLGDMPLISEIDLIPQGHSDVDLDFADSVSNFPAASIKNFEEKLPLFDYLASGVKACLKWEDLKYGNGETDFTLYADGRWHTYEVPFPVWGDDSPNITLDCINYPVTLNLSSVYVDYLHSK